MKGRKKIILVILLVLLFAGCVTAAVVLMNRGKVVVTEEKDEMDEMEEILEKEKKIKVPLIPDMDWYEEHPERSEYTITTKNEFLGFLRMVARGKVSINFAGKTVKLGSDIILNEGDMSEWDYESDDLINISDYQTEKPTSVSVAFQGTFDGQGHTISGVYGECTGTRGAGLFLYTGRDAVIKNVRVENSYFQGTRWAGGLVAHVGQRITVAGVYVQAKVVAELGEAGGFAGDASNSVTIRNSSFDCEVVSLQNTDDRAAAGGIIGSAFFASPCTVTLENVLVKGRVRGVQSGGIIGVVRNISEAWNFNLSKVAVGAALNGETSGKLVGAFQEGGELKKTLVFDDIKNTYTLKSEYKDVGEAAIQFSRKGTSKGKTLEEMEALVNGVQGYKGGLGGAAKLEPDISWYTSNKDAVEYVLTTREQFLGFISLVNNDEDSISFQGKVIKLGTDVVFNQNDSSTWNVTDGSLINLADYQLGRALTADSKTGRQDGRFSGTFDGQGHTISGVSIYREDLVQGAGLILYSGSNAVIKNVNIVNSHMECTGRFAGGIFGQIGGAVTIDNVNVQATVRAWKGEAGGLTGDGSNNISITNSVFDCKVSELFNTEDRCGAGGLVGSIFYTGAKKTLTVNNVQVLGSVDGVQSGGLVGVVRNISHEWNLTLIVVGVGNNVVGETSGKLIGAFQTGENAKTLVTDRLSQVYTLENGKPDLGEKTIVFQNNGKSQTKSLEEIKTLVSAKKAETLVPDTSWYDETKTTFILQTKEAFLGFISMVNNGANSITFKGKTVLLDTDITFNEGDLSELDAVSAGLINLADYQSEKPTAGQNFQGTFDGQGHTVSGACVYATQAAKGAGLFLYTGAGATIKNLNLVNSYMECTGRFAGGLIGQVGGTLSMSNVNINAKVIAGAGEAGGIAGDISNNISLKNAVIDCDVISLTNPEDRGGAGGIAGSLFFASPRTINLTNVRIDGSVNGVQAGGIAGVVRNISVDSNMTLSGVSLGTEISGDTCGTLLGAYQTGNNACATVVDSFTEVYTVDNHLNYVGENTIILKNSSSIDKVTAKEIEEMSFGQWVEEVVADTSWYNDNDVEFILETKEEFLGFISLINNGSNSINFEGRTVKLGQEIVLNSGNANDWKPELGTLLNVADYQSEKADTATSFKGTFDGQNHSITGLYIYNDTAPSKGAGLFLYTGKDAVIKNVSITNAIVASVHTNGRYAGGLIGQIGNTITIENVSVEATVKGGSGEAGGLAGDMSNNTTVKNSTFNCVVETTGNTDDRGGAGGLVGTILGNRTLTLDNVRIEGSVNASQAGGIVGVLRNSTTAPVMNLTNVAVDVKKMNETSTAVYGKFVGAFQTGSNTNSNIDNTFENVYTIKDGNGLLGEMNIMFANLGIAGVSEVITASEIPSEIIGGGSYVSNPQQQTALAADVTWFEAAQKNGTKEVILTTANQFLGFMKLLTNNNGNYTNGQTFEGWTIKLGNDIVINNQNVAVSVVAGNANQLFNAKSVQGTKPGGASSSFKGTFDGQGYTISGIYIDNSNTSDGFAAIFPATNDGAVIKNVTVTNSYLKGQRYVGGLVGQHMGGQLEIEKVYVNADIITTEWSGGGLVGEQNANVSIKNSTLNNRVSSTKTGTSTKNSVGGVVGTVAANGVTISLEDVSILGTVKNEGYTAGGIVGLIREGKTALTLTCNSVGVGAEVTATKYSGRLIGSNVYGWSDGATCTITNSFTDLYVSNSGSDLGFANGLKFKNTSYTTTTKTVAQIGVTTGLLTDWYKTGQSSYEIKSAADFLGLQCLIMSGTTFKDATITLKEDLVMNAGYVTEWTQTQVLNNLATLYVSGKAFEGTFDGGGHTISGVFAQNTNTSGAVGAGLFLQTGAGAVIRNLKLVESKFEGYRHTGSILGQHAGAGGVLLENVVVSNVSVKTTDAEAGGVIGSANGKVTVNNVTVDADVSCTGTGGAGGIVGRLMVSAASNRKLSVENVIIRGTITGTKRSGGIVGCVRNEWGPNNNASAYGWELSLKDIFVGAHITATENGTSEKGTLIGGVSKLQATHTMQVDNVFENVYVLKTEMVNTDMNYIGDASYFVLKAKGEVKGIVEVEQLPNIGK